MSHQPDSVDPAVPHSEATGCNCPACVEFSEGIKRLANELLAHAMSDGRSLAVAIGALALASEAIQKLAGHLAVDPTQTGRLVDFAKSIAERAHIVTLPSGQIPKA